MKLLEFLFVLLLTLLSPLILVFKIGSGLLLLCYLLIPLWAYFHQPKRGERPSLEFVDWESYPLPDPIRERLKRAAEELQELGFLPALFYEIHMSNKFAGDVAFLFYHPTKSIKAILQISYSKTPPAPPVPAPPSTQAPIRPVEIGPFILTDTSVITVPEPTVSFGCQYRAPEFPTLGTSNTPHMILSRPCDALYPFPHITEASRLLELLEKLDQRDFSHLEKQFDVRTLTPAGVQQSMLRADGQIVDDGNPDEEAQTKYQPMSLLKICWACWTQLPPFGPIFKRRQVRQARRLERELLGTSV